MATFYVSPEGNDRWSGQHAAPLADGSDGPFSSLGRARDAMRADGAPDTTYVRAGTYHLDAPLALTGADSGNTFAAHAGERPVVSGGDAVTNWSAGADGVWTARLDVADVQQLTVDGVRQSEARYPNADPANPIRGGWLWAEDLPGGYDNYRSLAFNPDDLDGGRIQPGMKVTVFHEVGYGSEVLTVESVDDGVMTFTERADYGLGTNSRFFVADGEVHLDQPGEWYFDQDSRTLHFRPPSGFDGGGAVVSSEQTLVDIRDAQDIAIRGLRFTDTTIDSIDSGAGAVRVEDSSGIVVSGNSFANVGSGVRIGGESHHVTVSGNSLGHIWAGGIELGPQTGESLISNNHIHHTGEVFRGANAITLTETFRNTISHNRIEDVSRMGIYETNYNPDMPSGGHVIEYNEILRSGRETTDTGAIYAFSHDDPAHAGDTIRYNRIVDTGGVNAQNDSFIPGQDFSFGIYLDNMTSNAEVHGNYVSGTVLGGIIAHGGSNISITNNVLTRGREFQIHLFEMDEPMGNIDVRNNVVEVSYTGNNTVMTDPDIIDASFSNNVYYDPNGAGFEAADHRTWEQWLDVAGDVGSLITDPLFNDAAGGDYSLASGSPALARGFEQLPWDEMGTTGGSAPVVPPAPPPPTTGGSDDAGDPDTGGSDAGGSDTAGSGGSGTAAVRKNGTDADEELVGGAAGDVLGGSRGDDTLEGGAGADIFVFTPGYDTQTISDFNPAHDRIHLRAADFDGYEEVESLMEQDGGDTIINFGDDESLDIVIAGVTPDQLDASDFLL